MTDAYATLREMLANVPDDAQVYVREMEEVVVEWPGITAGTFRQLLAEIAGFEWGWEQREKAHDAEVAEAKREAFKSGMVWGINAGPDVTIGDMLDKVDAQYPVAMAQEAE
jgi:hypothetical protein